MKNKIERKNTNWLLFNFPDSSTNPHPTLQTSNSADAVTGTTMGSKRGRLLIRQSKIRKDIEQTGTPTTTQSADLDTPEATVYSQCLLSVPRIERHASEPTPTHTVSSPSLLAVPTSSLLIKQHSHPLLPSQSSSHSPPPSSSATFSLQRQLSHPLSTTSMGFSLTSPPITPQHLVPKMEPLDATSNPMVVIVSEASPPPQMSSKSSTNQRLEELQRSISTPAVRNSW